MLIVPIAIQLVLFCTRLQGTASWFLLLVWKLVRQLCRLVASSFALVRESIVLFVVRRSSSFCRVLRTLTWFFFLWLQLQSLEHRAGRVDLFELGIRKAGLFVFLVFRSFGVSDPVFGFSLKKNFRRILSTLLRLLCQQEWTYRKKRKASQDGETSVRDGARHIGEKGSRDAQAGERRQKTRQASAENKNCATAYRSSQSLLRSHPLILRPWHRQCWR